MDLRLPILRCYIEPILLYGCGTWALMTADKKTPMATEMWFLSRNVKIKWTDKVTNKEVLKRAGTKRWMMNEIAKRQASFFGHIIRKQGLENFAMISEFFGRKSQDRQRAAKFYSERLTRGTSNSQRPLTQHKKKKITVISRVFVMSNFELADNQ